MGVHEVSEDPCFTCCPWHAFTQGCRGSAGRTCSLHLHSVYAQEVSLQALLARKRLALLGAQRALRAQVAMEQRLQQDAAAEKLADWTRWRRQPAWDDPVLSPPIAARPLRLAASAMPSAQELHEQMQRCAHPEPKHPNALQP